MVDPIRVQVYFTDPTAGGGRTCREIYMTLAELPRIGETLLCKPFGSSQPILGRVDGFTRDFKEEEEGRYHLYSIVLTLTSVDK